MTYSNILFEQKGAIATITINRPDKLNALNAETLDELENAMQRVYDDASVGGVLITGSGGKAFVAGADISGFGGLAMNEAIALSRRGQHIFNKIENCPKPVIALVNGFALGGGCELAMACHFRYASENARFGQPEVNLGLVAGYGGTQRLPRLVGKGPAMELLLSGDMVGAERALEMGLVNKVCRAEELLDEGMKTVGKILEKAPLAVRYSIEAVNKGGSMALNEALDMEANYFGMCFTTEDMKEGTTAFLEKRKANFKGK